MDYTYLIYICLAISLILMIIGIVYTRTKSTSHFGAIDIFISVGSMLSLILAGLLLYYNIAQINSENTAKIKQFKEVVKYNESKRNDLLSDTFGLPTEKMLIEEQSNYYKVTTNTGIYKITFDYNSKQQITKIKENIQITSTTPK
ncbi:hypothetical protein BVG00_21705 [Bacillus cereus]|uniref:DUF3290 family protein n=1 Tax=Bacillus cereus TaxID=1396 RepID=UPI00099BA4B6|nr:DUF3290 family protein [Bacillus cereus]OPD43755.1 hypothetical protein BVG00_21705 [Bacillus cereus]